MRQVLVIPGRLPGLNEWTDACRSHAQQGGRMKREAQDRIGWCIRQARLRPMAGKVDVRITWVEPNMRRDKDNIHCGTKFVLDALVEQGILVNDNWTYIGDLAYSYAVNRAEPKVIVELEEA